MVLRPGLLAVATKLQEAQDMSHNDVRARLADAVNDAHRGTGKYGYYVDHTGDGESGDVIYSSDGDMRSAPYELSSMGGKATANIDTENSKNVVPRTTYEEESDDDDQYASMEEAGLYTKGPVPVIERFISKDERSKADEGSFAGKGKSFPILKPGDVSAAVHAMGRAGSGNYGMAQLKANIIRIAKAKGWTSSLPKAWQGDDAKESVRSKGTSQTSSVVSSVSPSLESTVFSRGTLVLQESAATIEPIVLRESKADYEIKLIAPGKGSSAFYPAEVLKRDGPRVFAAGTHVYLNHPTAAEEAARPEGDVKNLAGVLSTAAVYHEAHAKGPGLYARMKVFADHAQTVEEKAPHVGMSIRASGVAEARKMIHGVPVLKELTSAESVDVVTKAGAGGMILTEAARAENKQEVSDMDADKIQKLQESLEKTQAQLALREARADAKEQAAVLLESVSLPAAAKSDVISRVVEAVPMKDGALDSEKLKEMVESEAKRIGKVISESVGGGRVTGFGASLAVESDPKAEKKARKEAERLREGAVDVFASLMGNRSAAERAVGKGA